MRWSMTLFKLKNLSLYLFIPGSVGNKKYRKC